MPGFDGKGPRGLGPMSGRGHGFCMLKIQPGSPEPVTGFAGLAGWPVGREGELVQLRAQALEIRAMLEAIERRIEALRKDRPPSRAHRQPE
ncbi:MAG: DUF5320 domain-containing protein [bacterium]